MIVGAVCAEGTDVKGEPKEPKRKRTKNSQTPQSSSQSSSPSPSPQASQAPQRAIDAELEAARDRAVVGDGDEEMTEDFLRESTREIPREVPVRLDPLHEFLAVYDEGDLAHVVDFGATSQAADDEKRFLSFDLAGEAYAASIMDIREILKFASLTEVPRAPREVLGVLSKRGIVMPVVDLGAILGLRPPEKKVDRDQRVLVAGDGERVCGLRVDRVHEVVRLAQRAIEDVPPSLGARNAHMLIGLGRVTVETRGAATRTQMLILLDVPAVLAHFSEAMGIAAAPGGSYGEGAT